MSMNWKQAFALGLCSVGAYAEKKPVAYFYPSVVLPDIETVWTDKETYPYACIYETLSGTTMMLLMDRPVVYKDVFEYRIETNGVIEIVTLGECFILEKGSSCLIYKVSEDGGSFEYSSEIEVSNMDVPMFSTTTSNPDNPSGTLKALWTNTPLIKGDGSVYFSAPTPVPAGNGMVAYKGVRLPKLPEWDRMAYPYAAILLYESAAYFHVVDKPFYSGHEDVIELPLYTTGLYWWMIRDRDSEWTYKGVWDSPDGWNADFSHFAWTNTNIFNTDNSICLAASDPIPVYE